MDTNIIEKSKLITIQLQHAKENYALNGNGRFYQTQKYNTNVVANGASPTAQK